jgi:hypothetical protein
MSDLLEQETLERLRRSMSVVSGQLFVLDRRLACEDNVGLVRIRGSSF